MAGRLHEVTVYSTPACPYCDMVKKFLHKHKIEFTEFDVSRDHERLREMMHKSGQTGVPVIDIDGKIIIGYDAGALGEALDL